LAEVKEKGFNPLSLRYFFLQAHYRSKQNFTWEALEAAQNGFKNIQNQIRLLGNNISEPNTEYKNKFTESISDDFNCPQALAVLQEVLKSDLPNNEKLTTILDFDKVLGLKLGEVLNEEIPEEVLSLAQQREEARKNKNWEEADLLRNEMFELGYDIDDAAGGFTLKKK
jgi:cysteinyl-tRNA synthetase